MNDSDLRKDDLGAYSSDDEEIKTITNGLSSTSITPTDERRSGTATTIFKKESDKEPENNKTFTPISPSKPISNTPKEINSGEKQGSQEVVPAKHATENKKDKGKSRKRPRAEDQITGSSSPSKFFENKKMKHNDKRRNAISINPDELPPELKKLSDQDPTSSNFFVISPTH